MEKIKTFFFFAYEGFRLKNGGTQFDDFLMKTFAKR